MSPEKKTLYDWLKMLVLIVLVIYIGMLALNQTLAYIYKSEFLQSPCAVCKELNPDVEFCSKEIKINENNNYNMNNIIIPTS